MSKNKKIVSITIIAIFLIALGLYLYKSDIKFLNNTFKTGSFSANTRDYPQVKKTEIVELKNGENYDLTASFVTKDINGQKVKMLAYNGSIPGPVLKVTQGSQVTINFINNTDVDSTIHPHGIRLDNKFDGVAGVTQDAVKPGESFRYKIKFPDAGAYWYHPHVREDYTQELGLYGMFLVTHKDHAYWNPVNQEVPLFLDDILLENGKIADFSKTISNHTLMGRFGNVMLVNGESNYTKKVNSGEVVRFYITNSANTRIFNLTIPNAKIKLVGGDNGKYQKESFVDSVMIGPAEREIIEVLFDKPGTYELTHATPEKTYTLGTITASDTKEEETYLNEFTALRTNHDTYMDIESFKSSFDKTPDKSITLSLDMQGMGNMNEQNSGNTHMMHDGTMMENSEMTDKEPAKIEWEDDMGMMNIMSNSEMVKWKIIDEATKKVNKDIGWQFKKGDKVKIKIFNDPKSQHPMQHPIHIHGQRFLVLSTNGVKNSNLVWKDTSLIQTGDTVEILADMSNPGDWMLHCHIPEHLESGMMLNFKVI